MEFRIIRSGNIGNVLTGSQTHIITMLPTLQLRRRKALVRNTNPTGRRTSTITKQAISTLLNLRFIL